MRIGAFGGTSLASGTDALLSEQRLAGGSSALAAVARRLRQRSRYPGDSGWTPADLFAANEVGVWYDPNDLRTLFQDSTGVTPVTDVGQPVGLVLDKARWDGRGVVNLIRSSENFTAAAGWFQSAVTISGTNTIIETATTNFHAVTYPTVTAPMAVLQVEAEAGTRSWLRVALRDSTTARNIYFDLANGTVGTVSGSYVATISPLGSNRFLCTVVGGTTASSTGVSIGPAPSNGTASYLGDTSSNIIVHRVQYELGSQPTEYQKTSGALGGGGVALTQTTATSRPTLEYDSATGAYYLAFDGTDDFLQGSFALDLASSNMTVLAGVQKESDAAAGVVIDPMGTTTSTGRASLQAPSSTLNNFAFISRGLAGGERFATSPATFTSPSRAVLVGLGSTSESLAQLRANGTIVATNVAGQFGGNYNAASTFVGRRGGTTLPFRGRIFGLVVRSVLSTDDEIAEAEQWLSRRVGVSLP